jgi:hypothetical protein
MLISCYCLVGYHVTVWLDIMLLSCWYVTVWLDIMLLSCWYNVTVWLDIMLLYCWYYCLVWYHVTVMLMCYCMDGYHVTVGLILLSSWISCYCHADIVLLSGLITCYSHADMLLPGWLSCYCHADTMLLSGWISCYCHADISLLPSWISCYCFAWYHVTALLDIQVTVLSVRYIYGGKFQSCQSACRMYVNRLTNCPTTRNGRPSLYRRANGLSHLDAGNYALFITQRKVWLPTRQGRTATKRVP